MGSGASASKLPDEELIEYASQLYSKSPEKFDIIFNEAKKSLVEGSNHLQIEAFDETSNETFQKQVLYVLKLARKEPHKLAFILEASFLSKFEDDLILLQKPKHPILGIERIVEDSPKILEDTDSLTISAALLAINSSLCDDSLENLKVWMSSYKGADNNLEDIVALKDTTENTTIIRLVELGNVLALTALLKLNNKTIDISNVNGDSPLFIAVEKQNMDIIKLLVNAGANVSKSNLKGWTPLHSCAYNGFTEGLDYILSQKTVKIDATNEDGNTALMLSVIEGHEASVASLLAAGADIHTRNNDKLQPLCAAIMAGSFNLVKMLLAAGAKVTIDKSYITKNQKNSESVVMLAVLYGLSSLPCN